MARPEPITTRPGKKSGQLTLSLPPGWELRLRRVLREINADTMTLPNPRERGLTPAQREARTKLRRRRLQDALCRYVSDLLTADIVGKEVALSTRGRYGARRGSLREHILALLGTASEK
jgi:hypothetical protein